MSTERYTHGHVEPVMRSHRWRTAANSAAYLLPHLAPGTSLLDVGCGPGNITVDLAARVAPGRVVGIDASPDNQTLTGALLSVARQFGMYAVAEGVETVEEAAQLRRLGVDYLQGYLFGAPKAAL